jgi:hypothetical protein
MYLSPEYLNKYISIIDDYLKTPLLASLQQGHFTFYNDETSDITSIEQMAVYATFEHMGKIKQHFVGIYPVSKEVGTSLSAENIMLSLEKHFKDMGVDLRQAKFACMDTTNVNSGNRGGLKRHLAHIVPMLFWVGCGNHKLALCFKHLLGKFPVILETDAFLEALWKYFKYRTLAMASLERFADLYNETPVVRTCPSVTRWTAHERCCKSVLKGYRQILSSLIFLYNERKEPESLGLIIQLTTPKHPLYDLDATRDLPIHWSPWTRLTKGRDLSG